MKTVLRSELIGLDTETTGLGIDDVPVGVSVSDGHEAQYASWGHEGGGNNTTLAEAADRLNSMKPGKIIALHNGPYDVRMLRSVGVDLIGKHRLVDVGYMAALLNPYQSGYSLGEIALRELAEEKPDDELNEKCAEAFGGVAARKKTSKGVEVGQAQNYWRAPAGWVSEYAKWDAWATTKIYMKLLPLIRDMGLEDILDLENAQIPILVRMFERGVRVDLARAEEHYARITTELAAYERQWSEKYDVPLVGKGSRTKLHALWREQKLPFAKTKKGNPSIPQSIIADHKDTNEAAGLLFEIRPREKFRTTFLKGYLLDKAVRGRVHPSFHPVRGAYGGTMTGRYSSSGPNLQNPPSPKRDDPEWPESRQYGHLFRSMFLPDEGKEWLSADYSQIEYRFFAHYAGGQIRQAFIDDPFVDFHQWCADQAGVDRSVAKNGNFAKLYGAGTARLAATLGVSVDEAKRFIIEYDAAVPDASSLFNLAVLKAEKRGYITTWAGRRVPFLYRRGRYIKTHAALNYLLQGSAADLLKKAMVAVDQAIDWDECVLHTTVHDELNLSHPPGSRWPAIVKEAMQDFQISVPIFADVEVGPNWGQLSTWKG